MARQDDLPSWVVTVAEAGGYGSLQSLHRPYKRGIALIAALVGFFSLLAATGLAAAVSLIGTAPAVVFLAVAVVAVPVLTVVLPYLAFRRRAVFLFEGGFVRTGRNGTRRDFLRWDEAATVRSGTLVQEFKIQEVPLFPLVSGICVVARPNRSRVKIGPYYQRGDELARAVDAGITRSVLPRIVAAVESGQTVGTRPLTLSRAGLQVGRRTLPWSQVKSCVVEHRDQGSKVVVRATGRKLAVKKIRTIKVENATALCSLADGLIRSDPSRAGAGAV